MMLTLLMTFFINLMLIEAKLFPQSPYFASNILRFVEEPDKVTKMLPEPIKLNMAKTKVKKQTEIRLIQDFFIKVKQHYTNDLTRPNIT